MYDAIIVGAGPAGSSAAFHCNKLGLKTLLLDKSSFPRDKVCGDALSGKSVRLLDEMKLLDGLNKLDGAMINRIIFGNPNHSECELHLNKSLNKRHISHGYVIPRKSFDHYLFTAASKGSDVKSDFHVTDIIYENEHVLCFKDINSVAPIHYLIIPKKEIRTLSDIEKSDKILLGELFYSVRHIAKILKINKTGYRLVINCNEDGGQTVFHLHMHIIGGKKLSWPPG